MNIDNVKEEISNLLHREIMLRVSANRSKKCLIKGIVTGIYPRHFTVLVDDGTRSFTYADVAIGEVTIYNK